MDGLSRSNLASVLDFLDGAYRCRDVDHLARHIASELVHLLPCECSANNEINPRRRRINWVYDGIPPIADGTPTLPRVGPGPTNQPSAGPGSVIR